MTTSIIHDVFTNTGRVYTNERHTKFRKRAEPPRGTAIINLLSASAGRENYRSDPNQGIYRRTLSVYGN